MSEVTNTNLDLTEQSSDVMANLNDVNFDSVSKEKDPLINSSTEALELKIKDGISKKIITQDMLESKNVEITANILSDLFKNRNTTSFPLSQQMDNLIYFHKLILAIGGVNDFSAYDKKELSSIPDNSKLYDDIQRASQKGSNGEIMYALFNSGNKYGNNTFAAAYSTTLNAFKFDYVELKKISKEDMDKFRNLQDRADNTFYANTMRASFLQLNKNWENIVSKDWSNRNTKDEQLKNNYLYLKGKIDSRNIVVPQLDRITPDQQEKLSKSPINLDFVSSYLQPLGNIGNNKSLYDGLYYSFDELEIPGLYEQVYWSVYSSLGIEPRSGNSKDFLDLSLSAPQSLGEKLGITNIDDLYKYRNIVLNVLGDNKDTKDIKDALSHIEFNLLSKQYLTNIGSSNRATDIYQKDDREGKIKSIGPDYLYQIAYFDVSPKKEIIKSSFKQEYIDNIKSNFAQSRKDFILGKNKDLNDAYFIDNVLKNT